MRNVMNVLLFALACILPVSVGCSKGANPAAPSPVGGGTIPTGTLLIRYERPEDVHLKPYNSATAEGCMSFRVEGVDRMRLLNAKHLWPNGYGFLDPGETNPNRSGGIWMTRVGDRTFEVLIKDAPGGSNLPIQVSDGCFMSSNPLNHGVTGRGLTVNGIRLKDGETWAVFDHQPGLNPSITAR